MSYRKLIRNLRLIKEKVCPFCREECKTEEEAKTHCLKLKVQEKR